jgi:hypothetical protein
MLFIIKSKYYAPLISPSFIMSSNIEYTCFLAMPSLTIYNSNCLNISLNRYVQFVMEGFEGDRVDLELSEAMGVIVEDESRRCNQGMSVGKGRDNSNRVRVTGKGIH